MKFIKDFTLEAFFSKYEFAVEYNIGGSDIESRTIGDLLALADDEERRAFNDLYLGYTETYGHPDLRQAVAQTYESLSPENILCFAGAEEGIFALMNALLEPEDHALVLYPNYQSAETIPLGICPVSGIPLDPDHGWALDLDLVRDRIRPNTKLISVNFPNNPTGRIISREDYLALVDLCRDHDIYLFSDEVYRFMERRPELRLPQGADIYEKAFSLNVMSKAYGLPGLRLGWLAGRDLKVLEKAEKIKHYLTICNSAPSEFLATIALKYREAILESNRALTEANLSLLQPFFKKHTELLDWTVPDGGCIGFPRYKGPGRVEDWTAELVEKLGVLLVPGSCFKSDLGQNPTNHFRIGFGRKHFPQALARLDDYLSGKK